MNTFFPFSSYGDKLMLATEYISFLLDFVCNYLLDFV